MIGRWRWIDWVALVGVLSLVSFLHAWFADGSLTYDELWHLSLSAARASPTGWFAGDVLYPKPQHFTSIVGAPPIWRVWTGMAGVLHPPLYVVTLRACRELFGDSDRVAQAYSIAWSLVAVAFTFATARLVMGRALAIACGVAFGCAQTQAYFAQEVRGYQMLVGLGMVALWLCTRVDALGPSRSRAVALGIAPLPILLTHYFGFGAAVAIGVFGLIRLRGYRVAFTISLLWSTLVYCMIWLPFAIQQIAFLGTGDSFMHVEHVDSFNELGMLACAPFRLLVDRTYVEQPSALAGGLLLVIPWFLLRRAPWLLSWVLWLSCSLVALAVLDVARSTAHLTLVRYIAVASPAVVPLLVGCTSAINRRAAHAMAWGVAFMGAIYLYSGNGVTLDCESFATAATELEKRAEPGEAILAYHGNAPPFYGDMFLLTLSHSPTLFPRPVINLTKPLSANLAAGLPRRVWVMAGPMDRPIDWLVPGATLLQRINVEVSVSLYHVELTGASALAATRPSAPGT